MKILMLIPFFYPHIGGVEKHVLELSKILTKQKHKIIIITSKYDKNLKDYEIIDKILIIRYPMKNYLKIWFFFFKHRNIIKNVDLIHCHDYNTFYWIFPFKIINSNIFITFHGFEKYPVPKIYIILRKIAELFTKGNICIGKFILKYYNTKPNFISYGGVNTDENGSNNDKKSSNFYSAVFVGRLEPDTGVIQYIKALKILKYKYNINFHLELCGDGKLNNKLRDYCNKFDLSVNFNGFIRNLNYIYDQNEIIFCSGYLCIMESLLKKKVIISIYQNKLKEDYLKLSPFSKFIFIAKNPDEIAQIIKKYLISNENNEIIKNKIINGYKFSLMNDWKKLTTKYIRLWNNF